MTTQRKEQPGLIQTHREPPSEAGDETPKEPAESKVARYLAKEGSLFEAVEDVDEQTLSQGGVLENEAGLLVFDKKTVIDREIALIDEFLSALENNQPVGRLLGKEKPAFLKMLAELLALRKEALLKGDDVDFQDILDKPSLTLSNISIADLGDAMQAKLRTAAEMFKTHAQKEMIRAVIAEQISFVPFTSMRLTTSEEVAFDKDNLFDEGNYFGDYGKLDWLYTIAPDGAKELIISSQYGIDSVFVGDFENEQSFIAQGKFGIEVLPSDSAVKKTDDLVLSVSQGGAPTRPLFNRIRIIRKAISLDKELHDYLQAEEEKQREASRRTSTYSSSPPAASSSSSQSSPRRTMVSSS